MADLPQIRTRRWHDGHLPGAFESAQRVDTGRTGQLSPPEIESRDWKETLVGDDSCYLMKTY